MDYLSTTGNRLHDLELDRMIARLSALEAKAGAASTTTPTVTSTVVSSTVAGVRSITPGSGTQMSNDITFTAVGSLTLSQASNTITLTAPVLVAGTNITLTPAGNNITVAATGGGVSVTTKGDLQGFSTVAARIPVGANTQVLTADSTQSLGVKWAAPSAGATGVPAVVLHISPLNWTVPSSVTEFGGTEIYRAKHDLTNATQAKIQIYNASGASVPFNAPTMTAQYFDGVGAVWKALDGTSAPNLVFAAGDTESGWVTLAVNAQANVLLRIVGIAPSGTAACNFGSIYVQVK